jgi:hypothetical protein
MLPNNEDQQVSDEVKFICTTAVIEGRETRGLQEMSLRSCWMPWGMMRDLQEGLASPLPDHSQLV